VELSIRHRVASLLIFAGVIGLVVFMFLRVPGSFVPAEDQGYVFTAMSLPDGATIGRTAALAAKVQPMVSANPAVKNTLGVIGFDLIGGANKTNAATMFVPLKPWDERQSTAADVTGYILGKGAAFREGTVISFGPPAIRGLGTAGGFELYLQGRTNADPKALSDVLQNFLAALRAHPQLTGINSFFRPTTPQLKLEVSREKALALGVPVGDVFDALQSTIGVLYVNDFNKFGRTYRVQMQADAAFRARPEDIGNVFVRSATTGEMIPLKTLITVNNTVGPEVLERFNGYVGAKILGNGKPGVSSGDAIRAVEEVARTALPEGYQITWSGQAFQERRSGGSSAIAFGLALVMVFLILAALYERWKLPAAVVLSVPFAVAGALAFVMMRGMENDIYFQIGLVVLIGLAAKNAILIVEFAQQGYLDGMSAVDAAMQAARLRFRPIVMTSLAFVLGVVPLAFSSGAGAAARKSMGTGVFGGMLASTFIATIFIPLFFTMTATLRKRDQDNAAARAKAAQPADTLHTEEGAQ
jgi:HAE1 family hydrophobic/amphiphilic exporter-1/multidrug efflux pump